MTFPPSPPLVRAVDRIMLGIAALRHYRALAQHAGHVDDHRRALEASAALRRAIELIQESDPASFPKEEL